MENNVNGVLPVYDLNNRNGYGYGCDGMMGSWIWIFLLFALLGNNGWGNNQGWGWDATATFANGAMTRNEIRDGFDNQDIQNGIRGVQQGLCDGFYAVNSGMLQGFNGIQRDLCQGFNNVNANIAENRFALQNCCCETNRNIDAVRAENYKNTCEITNAIHAEGEATRALMTQNTIQELRDELQAAQLQLGNLSQTANIIGTLRPYPQPAYITCSPYQASNVYGCGFNAFNGCGNC